MATRHLGSVNYFGLAAAVFTTAHFAYSGLANAQELSTGIGSVEEVVVTARRREENAQQVPISITALGHQALEDRGISESMGLTGQVPNLVVKQGLLSNQSDIRLRGVPGVAVYVDGIAHSNTVGQIVDVVDVERIEVLRGPQGTLFGKNAIGGAIQYITAKPGKEFSGNAKVTFGSFERVDAKGTVTIPLTEAVSAKITGAALTSGGYIDSVSNHESYGSQQSTIARIDTLWTPSKDLEARVVLAYSGEHGNQPPMVTLQNKRVCAGDPIPSGYTGRVPGPLCVLNTIGLSVDENLDYGGREQWKSSAVLNGPAGYDYETYDGTVDISYALSDVLSLRSLTGYRTFTADKLADHDATPYTLITSAARDEWDEVTEELQLIFNRDWLTGTTGLYYYKNTGAVGSASWNYSDLLDSNLSAQSRSLGGRTPAQNLRNSTYDIEGWAAFSEWTGSFGDFALTLGGRYTSEDNTTTYYTPPSAPVACCSRVRTLNPGGPALAPPFSDTFTNFTPRASVQYQWTADVMTYATYSEGFNAGGFNTVFQAAIAYRPETLSNYEIGIKSDLFDRRVRLNAAAFRGDWDHVQVRVLSPVGQTVTLVTQNAGKGIVQGLETQVVAAATDNWVLNASVGYLDAQYTDIGNAPGLSLDTPFVYSPEFTYTIGSQYQWRLGSHNVLFRTDYTWLSDTETNIDPRFSVAQDGYGLLNARVVLEPESQSWSIALHGTNLTDQFYVNQALNITQEGWAFGQAGRPREVGVTFTTNF
jgi:iron complex outermembrane recepter protein